MNFKTSDFKISFMDRITYFKMANEVQQNLAVVGVVRSGVHEEEEEGLPVPIAILDFRSREQKSKTGTRSPSSSSTWSTSKRVIFSWYSKY